MASEQEIDPIWQVFKIGLGLFGIGIVVQVLAALLIPQGMALITTQGVRGLTIAHSALMISNWSMGLGAAITLVACIFFCVRATRRTQ